MKSCLILVTNIYPFTKEEAFIEPEAPFLSEKFDKVITLAIALDNSVTDSREVPENFDCYNVTPTSKKVSRAISLAGGALNALIPKKDLEPEAKKSIRHRVFYEYFCKRGEREAAMCEAVLSKYDFSEYDSVTVYSYWFFAAALVADRIYKKLKPVCKNIKFVSRAHGHDVYRNTNILSYLPKREYLLSAVDMLYPCSVNGEQYILADYPEFSHKVQHRYLGTFDGGISEMNDDCFHIVSCSRMIPLKRIERIASALALLKNENVGRLVWTHIGDGETMQSVRAVCNSQLGFMQVNLIGSITNEAVREFYKTQKVDLLINTSTTEGVPVSMMEALSFSVPVLATDVGGVGEIVRDTYNGFLISEDFTDEELSRKIKDIILSPVSDREAMRKNARGFWEDNFNAQRNFSSFAEEICG